VLSADWKPESSVDLVFVDNSEALSEYEQEGPADGDAPFANPSSEAIVETHYLASSETVVEPEPLETSGNEAPLEDPFPETVLNVGSIRRNS